MTVVGLPGDAIPFEGPVNAARGLPDRREPDRRHGGRYNARITGTDAAAACLTGRRDT